MLLVINYSYICTVHCSGFALRIGAKNNGKLLFEKLIL